jgi:hypothetical protein
LNVVVCSFFVVFYAFWNLPSVINFGWRYLLQTACLMAIPVVVFADHVSRRLDWRGRALALLALLVIFDFVSVRLSPTPALTSPRLAGYFGYLQDQFLIREHDSRFTVREWLRNNVPKGSTVLGQWSTNIAFPADPEPEKNILDSLTLKSDFGFPTAETVKSVRPDFIVFSTAFSVGGPNPHDPYSELDAIKSICPAPGALIPIGNDKQTFVMHCSLGKPALGAPIETVSIGGGTEATIRWAGNPAVEADGSIRGDSTGKISQVFPVPKPATLLKGTLPVIGDTWRGAFLIDVVWYAGDKEASRKALSFWLRKNRPLKVTFEAAAPTAADRVQIVLRTWRPQDGQFKVQRMELSWYRPSAPSPGQWPLIAAPADR